MAYQIVVQTFNESGRVRPYVDPRLFETEDYARKVAAMMSDDDVYARVRDVATGRPLEARYFETCADDIPF